MLRKRLIGVITIRNGWAVQSFGYQRYLPLGKPECLAENLDRWCVDEILIQVTDRSSRQKGPDLELISKIANSGISTPLVYSGGVSSAEHAVQAIRSGADRICVDALLHNQPNVVREIAHSLGAQAIIGAFPVSVDAFGTPCWYNYQTKQYAAINPKVQSLIDENVFSEALLIDHRNEGFPAAFDFRLLTVFSGRQPPLIVFGGLSNSVILEKVLSKTEVSAAAVGHFLNYKEHTVQQLKSQLTSLPLRPPFYREQR